MRACPALYKAEADSTGEKLSSGLRRGVWINCAVPVGVLSCLFPLTETTGCVISVGVLGGRSSVRMLPD